MSKVKFLIFFLLLFVCGYLNVKAFDVNSINLNKDNIYLGTWVRENENNTVLVNDTIYNSQTKAYVAITQITKSQFDAIAAKLETVNDAVDQCHQRLNVINDEVDDLEEIYSQSVTNYNNNQTAENEAAYNQAKTNYENKVNEYNAAVEHCNAEVDEKTNEYYQMIPFNDSFTEMNLADDEDTTAKDYGYYYGNYEYAVVWVKVVTGSNTYYNYGIVTADIQDHNTGNNTENEQTNTSENTANNDTNNNEQTNSIENPDTGIYYGCGILIVVAFVGILSYALIRRKSKFPRSV